MDGERFRSIQERGHDFDAGVGAAYRKLTLARMSGHSRLRYRYVAEEVSTWRDSP
jgi:hypothetical protein